MIETETVLNSEARTAIFRTAGKTQKMKTMRTVFFGFFLIIGLFYIFLALKTDVPGNGPLCGILGLLFLLVAFFGRKAIFALNERRFRKCKQEDLTVKYGFSEDGVTITGPMSESKYQWGVFDAHGTEDHYLWLHRRSDNAYVMVDKNKLSAEEEKQLEQWFAAV